jgi:pyruvate formate lyase activating enzyme
MPSLEILQKAEPLHQARWWEPMPDGRLHCYLCPRHCHISEGQSGFCYIRVNRGGKLYSLGYGSPAALQIDPIEKKPLNHFLPGTKVLSLGTAGCNMGCSFCQNWDISKSKYDQVHSTAVRAADVPLLARKYGCPSIAFTYNEPTIWGEYVVDICRAAREHGLKTVMVTNGYITREAFHDIYDHVDAANVDLKAFTEEFYGRTTLTHLQPVLHTLQWLKNETSVWFEITNLMIPALNDDAEETRRLADWIVEHLGPDVPLHFTAFHPDFKLQDKPRTPPETLHRARAIALEAGVRYVYEGNIRTGAHDTRCAGCAALLIERDWHTVLTNRLRDGACPNCGLTIPGCWDNNSVAAARPEKPLATSANYDHLNL